MGVGTGLYMYDVVVKRSRSLSHLLMSSCMYLNTHCTLRLMKGLEDLRVAVIMVAIWNRAGHYIFILWFVLLLLFFA